MGSHFIFSHSSSIVSISFLILSNIYELNSVSDFIGFSNSSSSDRLSSYSYTFESYLFVPYSSFMSLISLPRESESKSELPQM